MGSKAGGLEFGCVAVCLPVGSGMSRKVLLIRTLAARFLHHLV